MDRVLSAARLHLLRPLSTYGVLWLIVGASFVLNLFVWSITAVRESESAGTGGLISLYVTILVIHVMAMTQLLPFAMGMGLSRRSFYLGTALAAAVQAVVYGIALTALAAVEDATGGWGLNLQFWGPPVLDTGNAFLQVLVYAVPALAFAAVGAGFGVVWKRWAAPGMYGLIIGLLVVATGVLALIGWLDAWREVGAWFVDRSLVTLGVGLPAAVAAVVGALTFTGLRRVVP